MTERRLGICHAVLCKYQQLLDDRFSGMNSVGECKSAVQNRLDGSDWFSVSDVWKVDFEAWEALVVDMVQARLIHNSADSGLYSVGNCMSSGRNRMECSFLRGLLWLDSVVCTATASCYP